MYNFSKFTLLPNEYFIELPECKYFEDLKISGYLVSNMGRIYLKRSSKLASYHVNNNALVVSIAKKNSKNSRVCRVANIVLLSFSPRDDFLGADNLNALKVIHLDNNPNNVCIDNLIWSDGIKFNKNVMMRPRLINLNCEPIPGEIWSPPPHISRLDGINNYNYLISTYGRIYSVCNDRLLLPQEDKDGYYKIHLNGVKTIPISIHRLEMLTFNYVENEAELQVNHIDGNIKNNYIGNLEWVTPRENITHAYANNLSNNHFGTENNAGYISSELVLTALSMFFDQHMQFNEIISMTDINRSTLYSILKGEARVQDLFTFLKSKGINNIPDLINEDEFKFICDNAYINKVAFNSALISIGITYNSIKYPVACIIRNAILDKESWLYRKLFNN